MVDFGRMDEREIILCVGVFLTLVFQGSSQTMIGNCNKTYFHQQAALCQRIGLETLMLDEAENCSTVYTKQVECVDNHVTHCLRDTPYQPFIVQGAALLKVVMFSCTTPTRVTTQINPLLLQVLQCNANYQQALEMFDRIAVCWTNMASAIKRNRYDPALCGLYAKAKDCMFNETFTHCPSINVPKDWCNMFCKNGTDPDHQPHECPAIHITMGCDDVTDVISLYRHEITCQREFVKGMAASLLDTSTCSTKLSKYHKCLKRKFKLCFTPFFDAILLHQLTTTITSATVPTSFFCKATPTNVQELSIKMQQYIPGCRNEFFTQTEVCAKELTRSKLV